MPVEGKKSVSEFAQSIKAKYPQYKDVDDSSLVAKIVAKYPQYEKSVDFEVKKKDLSVQDSGEPATVSLSDGEVSGEPAKTKKQKEVDRLVQIAKEKPDFFLDKYKLSALQKQLIEQGYTPLEASEAASSSEEVASKQDVTNNTSKAKSYLSYVSGYGKEASMKKVANATEADIDAWTREMEDKGISETGINAAISDWKNEYIEKKGKEQESNTSIQIDDVITKKEKITGVKYSEEERKSEKKNFIDNKIRDYLPEYLKDLSSNNDRTELLIEKLKEKGKDIDPKEKIKITDELVALEMERQESGSPDRLYDNATDEFEGREKANNYAGMVISFGEKLTDKEKTLQNVEKSMNRYEAMNNLYNSEVSFEKSDGSGKEVITYRQALENYKPMMESALADDLARVRAEAEGIRENWLKSKAQFEAVNRAYLTNVDPGKVSKSILGDGGFFAAAGQSLAEEVGFKEDVLDTDKKFVEEYVSIMDDLGSYATPEQRENAKETLAKKVGTAVGTSLPIMLEIMAATVATEGLGTIPAIAKNLGRVKAMFTNNWGKTGKAVYNIFAEGIKGGVTFAPTGEDFSTGFGEGVAQSVIEGMMGKRGRTINKGLKYVFKTMGGTTGETISEYAGEFVNELDKSGFDVNKSFEKTFGRNIEDATDKLLVTVITSAMFSGAFNAKVLFESRQQLQKDYDEGRVPKDKMKDVEDVLEQTKPKETKKKSKSDSYVEKLEETKNSDPESYWSVSSVSKKDAKDGTVIETEDGSALVGKDGDIKGVFKNTDSKAKGVAEKLLKKAVEAGGVKLDNFDNYLSKIYKKAGFRVVSRTPFNEKYAPEGWNKEKHGTPDVVAMVYDPEGKLDIEEKTFTDPESGYDDAMDYRNSYVEQTETTVEEDFNFLGDVSEPTIEAESSIEENLEETAYKNGEAGVIRIDPENENTLVFETANNIEVLGNKDEVGKNSISEFGLTKTDPSGVEINKDGTIIIKGEGGDKSFTFVERSKDKKGEVVVKLKDEKGLIRKVSGSQAEIIAKEMALMSPKDKTIIKEATTTAKKAKANKIIEDKTKRVEEAKAKEINRINKLKEEKHNKKTEAEKDSIIAKAEKEATEYENKLLNEAEKESKRETRLVVESDSKSSITVGKKADGTYTVSRKRKSDGKSIPITSKTTRDRAIAAFESKKQKNDEGRLETVAELSAEKRKEESKKAEDAIEVVLQKIIDFTKNNRSYDVTLGLPMAIVNSSARIVKATYTTTKSSAKAIKAGYDYLKKNGYKGTESDFKAWLTSQQTKGKVDNGTNKKKDSETKKVVESKPKNEVKEESKPKDSYKKPVPTTKLTEAVFKYKNTEDIESSLEEIRKSDWYGNLTYNQAKAFDLEFTNAVKKEQSNESVSLTSKENPFVKKRARTLLKNKIKATITAVRKTKILTRDEISALQKNIKDYANDMLKQYNLSPAKHKQVTNTIVKAVSIKELKNAFSSINKMVREARESKRKDTIKGIYKILGNKKEILKKKAGKWVGKAEPEVQKFIREYDTSNLDNLTLQEAEDIMTMIKGKLKDSVEVVKAKERVKRAEKRRIAANSFVELYSGKTETVNSQEELEDALSNEDMVAIVNGQLITSKGALKELFDGENDKDKKEIKEEDSLDSFMEDNPEQDFDKVKVYKLRTREDALTVRRGKTLNRVKDALRYVGLSIYGAANLELNLSPLYRGSKKLRETVDKIVRSIAESDYKYEKNTIELQKKFSDRMVEVMAKKNKVINTAKKLLNGEDVALRRLSKDSKTKVFDGHEGVTPSNSLMIDYYNMYQTDTGHIKMNKDAKVNEKGEVNKYGNFDVVAMLDYMNDPKNADLKAYADLLRNEIYPELKIRYEPTYEAMTGMKFDEGLYYPLYTNVEKNLELQSEGMNDGANNLSSFKSFSKNMISRVENSKNLNYNTGSHEKLTDYIVSMERVHQFRETSDLVSATFNKASIPEMVKKVGARKFKAMRDHLDISITGVDPRAGKDNIGKKVSAALTSAVVLVTLPLKPVSLITQPVSFLHFSAAEGVKITEWLAGFAKAPANFKILKELATSTYIKSRVSAASKDIEVKRILKSPRANFLSNFKNKAIQTAMSPISAGDIMGVLGGASPMIIVRFKHHRDTGMEIEEAIEAAIMDVAIESESAQQSSRAYQTSHLQRDSYGRLFTIYKSSQISATNKMFNAVQKLKEWKTLTNRERGHYMYQLAYFSGASTLFSLARKGSIGAAGTIVYKSIASLMGADDEELTEEERRLLHDTVLDVTQSKLDGSGIPGYAVNQWINSMRGQQYYNRVPALEYIPELGESFGAGYKAIEFYATNDEWDEMTEKEIATLLKPIPIARNVYKLNENLNRYESGHKTLFEALINVRNPSENLIEAPILKDDGIWDMFNPGEPYYYDKLESGGKGLDKAARDTKKAMEDVPEAPYTESWKYKTE